MLTDIYMKFCEDTLKGFQVKKRGHECDRQMDRQTCRGKTIYLPTLKGGDVVFKMVAILDLQSE